MKYNKYWTDMHSNIHHNQMPELSKWFEHVKDIMDFWPIAYYPFYMRPTEYGLAVEDKYDDEITDRDWEEIRDFTNKVNAQGFPMFMGYEWQGSGLDGDHNVFFLHNDGKQLHPMRYSDLVKGYEGQDVIGIPHHIAYQLNSRGKNWDTHNEKFSPFAEIYSSHGSSETDEGPLTMNRHVHMGPRTGTTCYEEGLNHGYKVGAIASGDNHSVPASYEHGTMCVLATDNTKEAIWDAMINRRTYGVSKSRIEVDYSIDDAVMGSEITTNGEVNLKAHIKGTSAIDRVEIIHDNFVEEMVPHTGTWEKQEVNGVIRFKFRLELGWGPDTRVYKDLLLKHWAGALKTEGKLLSIEKCWNNYGQKITSQTNNSCEFEMTTYNSTATGKWMGPSNVTTEGFIFEIEADADSNITLTIDGKDYIMQVRDMLSNSRVEALWDEVKALTKERYGDITHYRDDPWWHNAYKFKLSRAYPENAYDFTIDRKIKIEKDGNIRLRIFQKNGDVAWTSPIFLTLKK